MYNKRCLIIWFTVFILHVWNILSTESSDYLEIDRMVGIDFFTGINFL